ncbi:MAG TPA: LamG-like jellyroll fold domain-containing protein [Myxococcota bacterium]|nr:LamG-like jellyroll fold domain-containing protein [Myxococcota bacterium]
MFQQQRNAGAVCLFVAALLLAGRAQSLPPGFVETPIGGPWNEVAGLAFSADGTRLYVVERAGKVWLIENGVKQSTPFLDISDEVGAWRDFGLLGFALHPNFDQNGLVYAFYVVDRYYLFNHGTPGYNPALLESEQFQATIGRLSRFTADPATGRRTILPGSEVVLIGATPSEGPPITYESHGTGQVVFGQDGTLLLSMGEGASYDDTDTGSDSLTYYAQALQDGIIQSWENVGAWRSQEVDSLSGKILRIDAFTGNGIPSNPWYDPAAPSSARSRVFALGLRNPYRFTLRPNTGSHNPAEGDPGTFYIGDVGWNNAESLHILSRPGQNFGWPAFEGLNQRATSTTASTYWNAGTANPLAKNPLGTQPGCSFPFLRFRDLIDQESNNPADPPAWPNPCNPSVQIPDTWTDPSDGKVYRYNKFVHSRPPISWRGDAWVATFDGSGNPTFATMGTGTPVPGPDFSGNTSTGGVWYTGTDFPAEWRNTYFHGDYGAGWIKSFGFDANDRLLDVVDFVDPGHSVTFVTTNPVTGGIYYVNWGSTVSEVRWVGTGNTPPTAVATPAVSWSTGSQLSVQFSGAGSFDPDPGAVLSYSWNFGDGSTSTQRDPLHVFNAVGTNPQTFTVGLTVTDEDGHTGVAQAKVSLRNSPPSVQITSPQDGGFYSMVAPTEVQVTSDVSDAEQGSGSLSCNLVVELVHNNHTHPNPPINACSANVTITPAGCDGNTYHWRFTLTVTDSQGLATTDSVSLAPDCSTVPNTPPIAQADSALVAPGGQVIIDVLANDTDPDGLLDPSSVVIVSPPSSGTAQVNPTTGAITYTHDSSLNSDSFNYTVGDNDGARSNAAVVSVSVIDTSGVVAAYGFEEVAGTSIVDTTTHHNDGSLAGATRTAAGRFGKALSFDGSSAMVNIPDSNSLELTTGMTLEAWVYPTAPMGDFRDVIYKGQNDNYYLEGSSPGGGGPAVGGTFTSPLISPAGALPLNAWSHVAATYDGAILRLFVNGALVNSRAQTGAIQTSTGPLTLGGDPLYGQYFAGLIDEVRVYNRALGASEIQSDMNDPVIPPNEPPVAVADSATVAEGGSVPIAVAANDTDAEGALNLASIAIGSGPSHGSVVVNSNGTVTYTHDGSETTSDSFTYTIRDAAGAVSNAATVSLTITPVTPPEVPAMNLYGVAALAAGLLGSGLGSLSRLRRRS